MSAKNTSKIITARKRHICTECGFRTIDVGERYLLMTMTPWHEMNQHGKYFTHRACLRCAGRHGLLGLEERKQLTAAEQAKTPEYGSSSWEDFQ